MDTSCTIGLLLVQTMLMLQHNCEIIPDKTLPDCDAHIDLLFLLDSSESVMDTDPVGQEGHTWNTIKNFTRSLVMHLPVGLNTSVAAIRYGSKPLVAFHLGHHGSSLTAGDALNSMPHVGGNTNTAAAFRMARTEVFNGINGARASARNVVVYIGDGISNRETHQTDVEIRYIKEAHRSKAEVFTVGISEQVLETELIKMASSPGHSHFLHAPRLEDLHQVHDLLLHRICGLPDPVVPTTVPSCTIPGCRACNAVQCFKCLDGKFLSRGNCEDCVPNCQICSNHIECERCKPSWYWEPATNQCEECELIADLALVVDNSGSIRDKNPEDQSYDNYNLLKEFINSLLDRVDIGPNATRVGAIKFSSMSQLVFNLDEYEQRDMVQQGILQMDFGGGHTNISGGLRMMREQMFVEEEGDRPDVGNIALLITDGESTIDKNLTDIEATLVKERGITLFVVGVTDEINEDELEGIASSPVDEHYFNSTDIRLLDNLLHSLTKHVCAQRSTSLVRTKT